MTGFVAEVAGQSRSPQKQLPSQPSSFGGRIWGKAGGAGRSTTLQYAPRWTAHRPRLHAAPRGADFIGGLGSPFETADRPGRVETGGTGRHIPPISIHGAPPLRCVH